MDNPGPFQLTAGGSAFPIAGPATIVGDWETGLEGMLAASLQASFQYIGGGTSVTVFFQTSLDQGQTPIDVAAVQFLTASGIEIVNLSALTPIAAPQAPTSEGLTPGTTVNGVLGDRLRAIVVVAGTYTGNCLLNLTGCAR